MNPILWTQKQDAGPSARQYPAMAYDSSRGRTVLFGGLASGDVRSGLNDTWDWDGWNWTQVADTGPPVRGGAAMAYDVQRNQTVLFSGVGSDGHFKGDTWGWDGRNWTPLADSGPSRRVNSAMAYDSKRQRIVLFGGEHAASIGPAADTWLWDGAAWTQAPVTGPSARYRHAVAYDSIRDRTVLFGGFVEKTGALLGDTWEWKRF